MIAVLNSSNGLTAIAGAPTPTFGHPFHGKGSWDRSGIVCRSRNTNRTKILFNSLHFYILKKKGRAITGDDPFIMCCFTLKYCVTSRPVSP